MLQLHHASNLKVLALLIIVTNTSIRFLFFFSNINKNSPSIPRQNLIIRREKKKML